MKIFNCPQLSPEWWELHRGIVTGSAMDRILTPKTRKPSASQKSLAYELIGQTLSNAPMGDGDGYVSRAMANGIAREHEARSWYALETGQDVHRVGFILTDCERFGCSPDGITFEKIETPINDGNGGVAFATEIAGGLELKCPTSAVHAQYLCEGVLPADYMGQVHGCLIVTKAPWWDFVSYDPHMEPFMIRVVPDDFTAALAAELEKFWEFFQVALAKARRK